MYLLWCCVFMINWLTTHFGAPPNDFSRTALTPFAAPVSASGDDGSVNKYELCVRNVWTTWNPHMIAVWVNVWSFYEQCMITVWAVCEHFMNSLWSVLEKCMTIVWTFSDRCMVTLWLLYEQCMIFICIFKLQQTGQLIRLSHWTF